MVFTACCNEIKFMWYTAVCSSAVFVLFQMNSGPCLKNSVALDEFCEYAVLAGRMDTRSSVGRDAPHFSEVCRQRVTFGLQRENARLLINGAIKK